MQKANTEKPNMLYSFFIGVLLFSLTCLYKEETTKYYYLIIMIEAIFSIIAFLQNKYSIKNINKCMFLLWLFMVFIMYSQYASLLPNYGNYSSRYINMHLIVTLVVIAILIGVTTDKMIKTMCVGSAIGSILSIIYVIINEKDIIRLGAERIGTSASGNVDVFGMYLGIMSIFVLYAFMIENKKKYSVIYILQIVFLLLTGSKQALFYIIISYYMFSAYKNKGKAFKYLKIILVAALFILLIFNVPVLYNILGNRIEIMLVSFGFKIEGVGTSASTDKRMDMISTAFKLFTEHPFFGHGWGAFAAKSGFGVYSHNTFTEILVNFGLFGFCLYYSMFFNLLFKLINVKNRTKEEQLFLVVVISMLLGDTARITFSQTALNYIMLFLAYSVVYNKRGINNE